MESKYKFRAWDEVQKYMVYQGTPDLETIQSFMFHFGDKTLMQFTGLYDKNGKEIYVGDILEHYIDGYKQDNNYTVENMWDLRIAMADSDSYFRIQKDVCIVGNVYENLEL